VPASSCLQPISEHQSVTRSRVSPARSLKQNCHSRIQCSESDSHQCPRQLSIPRASTTAQPRVSVCPLIMVASACLLYRKEFRVRRIDMSKYRSVELICALVTGHGYKLSWLLFIDLDQRPPISSSLKISLTFLSVCLISHHLRLLVTSTFTLTSVSLRTLLNSTHY